MPNYLEFAYRDYDGDRQQFTIAIQPAADGDSLWDAVDTELNKWLAGAKAGGGYFLEKQEDLGQAAGNPVAQSKSQAIVEWRDIVNGRTYRSRLPFPNMGKGDDGDGDPAFVPSGGVTTFNQDHADYATLVGALQAAAISPEGNLMNVQRIYIEE